MNKLIAVILCVSFIILTTACQSVFNTIPKDTVMVKKIIRENENMEEEYEGVLSEDAVKTLSLNAVNKYFDENLTKDELQFDLAVIDQNKFKVMLNEAEKGLVVTPAGGSAAVPELKVNDQIDFASYSSGVYYTTLPLNVNTSQLVLYIGEGVANGKLTDLGEESTGLINTTGLALRPRAIDPAASLGNVELFPYRLSITRGEAELNQGKDRLDTVIHYNLTRDGDYEIGEYEHKLVMEMMDPTGQSTEKTLTLGTDLTIGSNKSYSITLNNNFGKNVSGGAVRINLYDEFQGRRMLLGSQAYPIIYKEIPSEGADKASD
ncbi:hypothetical protein [Paenibacillus lactis]|uniref:hypothetical protein n=1 Tax=Paenibacillus lactis TaxID=228574 RepID=UPI00164322F2